ncbi:MAG: alpha/beta fold hydrolase [Terriglobales bacterium]|jgi:pimeloyl-ACP methyl ester carboxylesterase
MLIRSGDTEIFYDVLGAGPDVVLLHAFPLNHKLWLPVAERLASRFRVILMDLRGHGKSSPGADPATMEKHAADIGRVCEATGVGKAVFGGVSIGGYVLLEVWRRSRECVSALILADTKAQADAEPARRARLQAAFDVERDGPSRFLDSLLPKLVGETTRSNRPDLVAAVREMALPSTAAGIAVTQRGMAARPDSMTTLGTIDVPTLLLFGEEDVLTPVAVGETMQRGIPHSRLQRIPSAGHLAVFEQPDVCHGAIRKLLDHMPG